MKATYQPEKGRTIDCDVVATNEDGTHDLACNGVTFVTSCQADELAETGRCVIIKEASKPKTKTKTKK